MIKYKSSMFNIIQKTGDDILLIYNTRTTSAISVDPDFYSEYFGHVPETEDETTKQLAAMGFLVKEDLDEIRQLEDVWKKALIGLDNDLSSILIAPTMLCNARCYYCFEAADSQKREAGSDMHCNTMDHSRMNALVKMIVSRCAKKKIGIHWFGGEPLIAANAISYITDSLKDQGIEVYSHITTNGSLITDTIIREMKNSWNVKKIQITIDGIADEYNDIKNYKNRANVDYFSLVINNIRNVLNNDIRVNLRVNFDPDKSEQTKTTVDYLTETFGGYKNCFIYVAPITDPEVKAVTEKFETEVHPYYQLMKATEKYKRYQISVVSEVGDETYVDMFNQSEIHSPKGKRMILNNFHLYPIPLPCMAVTEKSCAIDPDGYLYRCHRLLGRGKPMAFGRLTEDGEIEIYDEMKTYFDEICFPYEECKSCSAAPLCMGGCKSNRILYDKPQVCCHVKAIMNQLILDYVHYLQH